MDEKDTLKEWLIAIVARIVKYPEQISVTVKTDEMGVLYTLHCHAEDGGKIIGRRGSMATAIRTLLTSAGMSRNIRASMKIDVPDYRQP